jgi:hypothetical protein
VVAGHDQLRGGDEVQEGPRRLEFAPAGPLGQVATDHQQGRRQGEQVFPQTLHDVGALGPEMEVGDMGEGIHGPTRAVAGCGASTRRARGRME